MAERPGVTLVGHPFAPTGTGERLRATFRALRAVGVEVAVRDVGDAAPATPPEGAGALRARLVPAIDAAVSIFVLDAEDRAPAFRRLERELPRAGHRIVYPEWALPRYPEPWARELEAYDEVWGASGHARDAFAAAVRRPVHLLPAPCDAPATRPPSRRQLGIPETAYAFLSFVDLGARAAPADPLDLVAAFARLRAARPLADAHLVVAVGGDAGVAGRLAAELAPHRRHATVLDRPLAGAEASALVRVADAVVSLHRASAFGLRLGEAMAVGRPVVATGWSGNMEYMTPATALLVGHALVPVPEGEPAHAPGQVWARPDVDDAARHMIRLVDDPDAGRDLGARASAHVRTHFSLRACGLRLADRLDEVREGVTTAGPTSI